MELNIFNKKFILSINNSIKIDKNKKYSINFKKIEDNEKNHLIITINDNYSKKKYTLILILENGKFKKIENSISYRKLGFRKKKN